MAKHTDLKKFVESGRGGKEVEYSSRISEMNNEYRKQFDSDKTDVFKKTMQHISQTAKKPSMTRNIEWMKAAEKAAEKWKKDY